MYRRDQDPSFYSRSVTQIPRDATSIFLRTISVMVLFSFLGALYLWWIRPAQLRWGATPTEYARSMPGDPDVEDPVFNATRAITIRATPEQIWPWLIQMGFGRAGFYGYDLIENADSGSGIHSADSIRPALQNPRPGDLLPLSVAATLVFGPIQPNRFVVWRSADIPCDGVFIWELVPIDATHSRLISRIRWNYVMTPEGLALGLFTEFADHIAVRKILEGVRDRAEARTPEPLSVQAFEIGSWLIGLLNLLVALFYVAFGRKWIFGWLLALGAGLLLELTLYGSIPVGIRATLPFLYFVLILLVGAKIGRSQNASRVVLV